MVKLSLEDEEGKDVYNAFYEDGILCQSCDNSFSHSENYTYTFLKNFKENLIQPVSKETDTKGTTFYFEIDTKLVKKCLLSILWRMAISKRDEFKNVQLNNIESELRLGLNNDEFMNERFFPVSVLSTKNINNVKANILSPPGQKFRFQHRYNYVYMYTFYLPDIVILYYVSDSIKIDVQNIGIKEGKLLEVNQEHGIVMEELLKSYFKRLPDINRF